MHFTFPYRYFVMLDDSIILLNQEILKVDGFVIAICAKPIQTILLLVFFSFQ